MASAVSPTPDQEDGLRPGLDPSQVTPGLLGFLATLVLVVAVIFLVRDMSRRIRRVRYQSMADDATSDGLMSDGVKPDGTKPDGTNGRSDAQGPSGAPASSDDRPGFTPRDR
nr:hypothetical protein [Arthrobacter sp. 260]